VAADDDLSDDPREPAARSSLLWDELGLTPVEIALPRGVGLTLRHYGSATTGGGGRDADEPLATDDAADRDDDEPDGPEADGEPDEDLDADDDTHDDDTHDDDTHDDDAADTDAADTDDAGDDGDDEAPVFLARRGTLLLFRSAEGLLAFAAAGHAAADPAGAGPDAAADPAAADHDLAGLPGWRELARAAAAGEIGPEDVVPDDEDRYELDLVVDNLRGGHDAWEPDLLIGAGEIARDLGFALGLREVLTVLSPGSPLDDLDEAVRDGGFLARRRARRIGADQAALAWRSVIGKITSAVEWRD